MKRILVVLLLAACVVVAVSLMRGREAPPVADGAWPEYDPEGVRAIALKTPEGSFALEQKNGIWRLRLPSRDVLPLADVDRVDALLDFLSHNRPIIHLRTEAVSQAGFAQADLSVTVNGVDLLELGAEDGSGVGVYARRNGEQGVFVLTREYLEMLSRAPKYYLDRELMRIKPESVASVEAVVDGEAWGVAQGKAGWSFTAPEGMSALRVHKEQMGLWLHEVATLRASGLADEPLEGVAPRSEYVLRGKGVPGGEARFALYAPADGQDAWMVRSSRQDAYFLLDPEQAIKVERNAFSLVDRRLAALDPGAVGRLMLSASGRTLRARRVGKSWGVESADAQLTGIDMLLWRLTDVQYEYGPVGALPASADERLRLELADKDGSAVLELTFYADTGLPAGQCWVSRAGEQGYYPVADQLYKDLQSLLPPAPEAKADQ